MPRDTLPEHRSWLLCRRCLLSHRQLKQLFAALCVPTLLLATAFLWWGYWYMLVYAVLELVAVGACLRHYARHAADYDHIDITPGVIIIEQRRARQWQCSLLSPWTTRLLPPRRDGDPVRLAGVGAQITLGEFLSAAQRRQLARDLAGYLPAGT
jgi:uncharacterized membrane protein